MPLSTQRKVHQLVKSEWLLRTLNSPCLSGNRDARISRLLNWIYRIARSQCIQGFHRRVDCLQIRFSGGVIKLSFLEAVLESDKRLANPAGYAKSSHSKYCSTDGMSWLSIQFLIRLPAARSTWRASASARNCRLRASVRTTHRYPSTFQTHPEP